MIGSSIFDASFSESGLQLIGRGGFSWIFLTKCNVTGYPLVIKKMRSQDYQTLQFLAKERDLDIYIAMEYCPLGSLERLLQLKQQLSLHEVTMLATQMIEALAFAHTLGLAHSDIKPENVLIRSENEFVLTDWGSAQEFSHQHSTALRDNTCYTPGFQAPELQNENLLRSDMKLNYFLADIYSLGMTLLRCIGPQFREIRTISSEADKSDHDWKIEKLFKTHVQGKCYQNGVIDQIIIGFLSYEKQSRMRLDQALLLLRSSNSSLTQSPELNWVIPLTQSRSYEEKEEDKIHLSQLKISTETMFSAPPTRTVNKQMAGQERRMNRQLYEEKQQSIQNLEEKEMGNEQLQEKQSQREIKRSRSNEAKQSRINKNLSISYLSELVKVTEEIDNFKAYLASQVSDKEMKLLCEHIGRMQMLRKLFLVLSNQNDGLNEISDAGIAELGHTLSKHSKLTELTLDLTNQSKIHLRSVNQIISILSTSCQLDTLSLSLSRVQIQSKEYDDFVDNLVELGSLKQLSISLCQTSVSLDDIHFICESAEAKDGLDKFILICPKNQISQDDADHLSETLSQTISEARVSIS